MNGLPLAELARRHGISALQMRRRLAFAVAAGHVTVDGDTYSATPEGVEASQAVEPLARILEEWRAAREARAA